MALFLGSLWPEEGEEDGVQTLNQIDLFKKYSLSMRPCAKKQIHKNVYMDAIPLTSAFLSR